LVIFLVLIIRGGDICVMGGQTVEVIIRISESQVEREWEGEIKMDEQLQQ
jgi:hypothetical protein